MSAQRSENKRGLMFTGIIEAVGEIKKVIPLESGIRIEITSGGLDFKRSAYW